MPDGKKIRYVYDGRGQRIAKKVNDLLTESYLYDDLGRIVTLYDANTVPREVFLYHSSSHTPDAIYRLNGAPADLNVNPVYQLVLDHLGNPKLVVSVFDNSIVQELAYDEFGNVTLDTNPGLQPFGFAGCLYDADTKLCHFGAREYDPSIGRWLARDPIGFRGGDTNLYGYVGTVGKPSVTTDTNLYSYTENDPLNFTDPKGLYRLPGMGGGSCQALATRVLSDCLTGVATANIIAGAPASTCLAGCAAAGPGAGACATTVGAIFAGPAAAAAAGCASNAADAFQNCMAGKY